MLSLIAVNSYISTNNGDKILLDKDMKENLTVYLLEGYLCNHVKNIHLKSKLTNVIGYKVRTEQQDNPSIITFLITDGFKWDIPYEGMHVIKYIEKIIIIDKITHVQEINIKNAYLMDNIPIGSFINGFMCYPVSNDQGKLFNPVTKVFFKMNNNLNETFQKETNTSRQLLIKKRKLTKNESEKNIKSSLKTKKSTFNKKVKFEIPEED